MCVQMPHAHKLWRAFSCVTDIAETEAILDLRSPENWIQTWEGGIKMFAQLLHHYASLYYAGGITDLDEWSEIKIQYLQGINTTLGDLLSHETKVEEFLIRLSGNLNDWRGTAMFFQYGWQMCTPKMWATKFMQWKIILPLEFVKPMLWAAAAQNSHTSASSHSRNTSTQFWLPVPVGDSTLEQMWPAKQARRAEHAKKQRRDVGPHHQRGPLADFLLIEPHVWSKDSERGEHDVRFATNMVNLFKAAGGYFEQDKEKMPPWWYTHFWDEL